ncbi:mycothiol transferase [Kribbella sp. WER1]
MASYQASVARSRAAVAGVGLVERSPGEDYTLRWIYLHMIEEYARHNGHADLLRECIDGATGE